MKRLSGALDAALELSVAGSFSRLGVACRSRVEGWTSPPRVDGTTFVVTGASSGIGAAIAGGLARLGASVCLVGRNEGRLESSAAAARLAAASGGGGGAGRGGAGIWTAVVDMTDVGALQRFARELSGSHSRIDGLVHCAGALTPSYHASAAGEEVTVATQVLGPFRLSHLLRPRLSGGGLILTVSSGGMYTQPFDVASLGLDRAAYDGVKAYARAKRAQVVLTGEWARRWGRLGITSVVCHPGWARTPGLESGLPSFMRLGPLLRTPEEGADTAVWLAAEAMTGRLSGTAAIDGIWHDRRIRPAYRWPVKDPGPNQKAEDGRALWDWCSSRAGVAA